MRVEILRPELNEAYDQYLKGQSCSLLYYGLRYKNFLKELLCCEEKYLLAMDKTTIRGVLPLMYTQEEAGRVYNSLPYYGSNGGVLADNPEAYRNLAGAYKEIAQSKAAVSSTIVSNPFAQQDPSDILYNYCDDRIGQFTCLELQGNNYWDELMAQLEPSAKRNIKKAIREGVTVEIDDTQMERLREIHQDNMLAIGGLPKTDKFFSLVPRHFTSGQDFDLYVAKKEGVVIAGLLLFYFNQTVEYYTPAVDSEYRSIQPLSLILITAMSEVARRRFKVWNWGGTSSSQLGVYRFKKKWTAMERRYHYYTQLNDLSILSWPQDKILSTFPNFFVVPFSELNKQPTQQYLGGVRGSEGNLGG